MGQTVIRRPTPQEFDLTLNLLNYQIDEFELSVDESNLMKSVKASMVKATHFWFNAYEGTRPVGFIGGHLEQNAWTGEYQSVIDYYYVLETHRDKGIYKDLMQSAKDWSDLVEAKRMIFSESTPANEHIAGVLQGQAFRQQTVFIKE